MRSPRMSFKSEIGAYRKKMVDPPEMALRILKRWESHPDVERIWATLTDKLPTAALPTAEEFIYLVLQRRMLAGDVKRVLQEEPKVNSTADNRAKNQLKNGQYFQLIRENEARREYQRNRGVISRNAKTAPRKIFISGWSDKFVELCGQPLDELVAALTEIAFDIVTTSEAVRGMRKPTTKLARDTRQVSVSRKD